MGYQPPKKFEELYSDTKTYYDEYHDKMITCLASIFPNVEHLVIQLWDQVDIGSFTFFEHLHTLELRGYIFQRNNYSRCKFNYTNRKIRRDMYIPQSIKTIIGHIRKKITLDCNCDYFLPDFKWSNPEFDINDIFNNSTPNNDFNSTLNYYISSNYEYSKTPLDHIEKLCVDWYATRNLFRLSNIFENNIFSNIHLETIGIFINDDKYGFELSNKTLNIYTKTSKSNAITPIFNIVKRFAPDLNELLFNTIHRTMVDIIMVLSKIKFPKLKSLSLIEDYRCSWSCCNKFDYEKLSQSDKIDIKNMKQCLYKFTKSNALHTLKLESIPYIDDNIIIDLAKGLKGIILKKMENIIGTDFVTKLCHLDIIEINDCNKILFDTVLPLYKKVKDFTYTSYGQSAKCIKSMNGVILYYRKNTPEHITEKRGWEDEYGYERRKKSSYKFFYFNRSVSKETINYRNDAKNINTDKHSYPYKKPTSETKKFIEQSISETIEEIEKMIDCL